MNRFKTRHWMLCAIGLSPLWFGSVHAQLPLLPGPAPKPEGRAIGLTDEIQGIILGMLGTYGQAQAYQDQGRVTIRQTRGRVVQITKMPSTLAFRRPNYLQMVGGGQLITSDGQTLQIALDGLGQYTSSQAPRTLTSQHIEIAATGGGLDQGYADVSEFLLGEDTYPRWIRRIRQIDLAKKPEQVNGHNCHVVRYETIYNARVDLYIDVQRHVLLKCVMDVTGAQDPPNAPPRPAGQELPTVTIAYELDPVRVDHPLADSHFTVVQPKHMRLVDRFEAEGLDQAGGGPGSVAPDPGELVGRLVGKPVPTVQGTDTGGQAFSPDQLRDRVTLLFLWSPSGGMDCLRAIQMVQRLADAFGNEPGVSVLGVSGDGDKPDTILSLLKAKRATFRNLIDEDNLTMRAFNVQSLPLFFIISGDGTVQHAWYGAPYEREQQIASKLKQELGSLR